MRKTFLYILLTGIYSNYFGQITTSINPTIAQLQQKLSGNGVTISGVTMTCPSGAYALYSGGTGVLSTLPSGILLTTGDATDVTPGFSDLTTNNMAPGSALGNNLESNGLTTYDGCYIKFLITPSCNTLSVNYVFASEEYSNFVGTTYNDVFGFVLDGPNPAGGNYNQTNIALVPGTSLPVTINNVNNGQSSGSPTGPCTNCSYFIDAPPGIEYNGSTTVLSASTAVTPCQTYTMTIGVWDVGDGTLDSGVFLDVNGISCSGSPTLTAAISTSVLCVPQTLTLSAGGGLAAGTYTWVAPASGGLSGTPGPTVTATPTANTTYTLNYSDVNVCPGLPLQKTISVTFTTTPSFSITKSPSGSACPSQSVTLTANGGASTYSWSPGTFLSSSTGSVVISTPSVTTTYSVTKTTTLGCTSTTVTTINVSPPATIAITPSISTICAGANVAMASSGAGPFTWTASSGSNPPSTGTVNVTPTVTTTYTVLSGTGTCTSSAVSTISVSPNPTISITPPDSTICSGQSVVLTSSGITPFTWTASIGANPPGNFSVTVSPTATTTYTVLSGTGACSATATASISVLPAIDTSLTISNPIVCLTNTVSITTSTVTTGLTYTWLPTAAIQGAGNTSGIIVQPINTIPVIYTVTISNGGCIATNTIQIKASVPPSAINFITLNNDTICVGGCVTFSSTTAGSQPMNYKWFYESGIGTSSVGVAPEACYSSAGSFSVALITTNACGTDTLVKSNYINVYDMPVLNV